MTYRCPYTETCRAEALRALAEVPALATVFEQQLQCTERDPQRAERCAQHIGLINVTLPALGQYVQERRRAQQIPVAQLAQAAGVDIVTLRDLEANKLDVRRLSREVLDQIAAGISASGAYLTALARNSLPQAGTRQGFAFTRTTPPSDQDQERHQ